MEVQWREVGTNSGAWMVISLSDLGGDGENGGRGDGAGRRHLVRRAQTFCSTQAGLRGEEYSH